ncbi:MAG: hypothetical protein ACLFQK_09345 [Fibrobacterota bacterium]
MKSAIKNRRNSNDKKLNTLLDEAFFVFDYEFGNVFCEDETEFDNRITAFLRKHN